MTSLTSRALEILGTAVKDTGREYFSNLSALADDARNVRGMMTKTTTDASDAFKKLKNTNFTKKISNWFYGKEDEYESLTSSDEFDAGFKIDDNTSSSSDDDDKPRALSADSMQDISNKQTKTLIGIGRHQAEQSVANTAEIISIVNTRTSEMITVMNSINKSLIGISSRLDKIIQLQALEPEKEESSTQIDKGGLYQDGRLSLMSIFEASKEGLKKNSVVSTGLSLAQSIFQGNIGPEQVAQMAIDSVLGKSMEALGGKSIADIGKTINDSIGVATQTAMNELINAKWFKTIFTDITRFDGDKNYGDIVPDTYDKKKALFDGMTRMSIVTIIPEMLAKINESISGQSHHIDGSGNWVAGAVKNEFNQVTASAYASSGITSQKAIDRIKNATIQTVGYEVSQDDIDIAGKALTATIVMDLHNRGTRSFTQSQLKGDMSEYISDAVRLLCTGNKSDPSYWTKVCQTIAIQLSTGLMDGSAFVSNINQSLQNMISSATEFAQSGRSNAKQATRLSLNMMRNQFRNDLLEESSSVIESDSSSTTKSTEKDIKKASPDSTTKIGRYTSAEYIRSIFGILNRGINVKVVSRKKPYENYNIERDETRQENQDDSFAKAFMATMGNKGDDFEGTIKEAIKQTTSTLLGTNGEAAAVTGGGINGILSTLIGVGGGQTLSSLANRALNGTLKNDVKNLFNKAKISATDQFNQINSNLANAIPKTHDKRFNELRDTLFGTDTYNEHGALIHTNGFIQNAASYTKNKAVSTFNNIKDKIKDRTDETSTGARQKADNFLDRHANLRNKVNDKMYRADTRTLTRDIAKFENYQTTDENSYEDERDRIIANAIAKVMREQENDPTEQSVDRMRRMCEKISNPKLKKEITEVLDIIEKRKEGAAAIENGEVAPIGSTTQTFTQSELDSGQIDPNATDEPTTFGGLLINVIKNGFKTVGNLLGKIAKFSAKMTTMGVTNIAYGAKTMAEGFFGGKRRDADGNVVTDENGNAVRDKGLFQYGKDAMVGTVKLVGKGLKFIKKSFDDVFSGIIPVVSKALKTVGSGIKKVFDGIKDKVKDLAASSSGLLGKIKNSSFGQRVSNLSFVRGATQGFKQAQSVYNKNRDKAEEQSTFANRQLGSLKRYLAGDTGQKSIFDTLIETIKGIDKTIKDTSRDEVEAINGENEEENEQNESSSNENSSNSNPIAEATTNATGNAGSTALNNASGGASPGINSISASTATAGEGAAGGIAGAGGGVGGGILGKLGDMFKGLMGNIESVLGKIFGGFGQVLFGIFQAVIGAVAALESVQVIMNMVQSILSEGVKPLNAAFELLQDAIKPAIDATVGLLQGIIKPVTTVLSALFDVITPIFDAVKMIMDTLLETLSPILEAVASIFELVLMPFMGIFQEVLVPLIKDMSNVLKIIAGAVQWVGGAVLNILGLLLTGLGMVIQAVGCIPMVPALVKDTGEKIAGTGQAMSSTGKELSNSGVTMIKEGIGGLKEGLMAKLVNLIVEGEFSTNIDDNDDKKDESTVDTRVNLGNDFGAGDVNTINNSWSYTYGSGNTTMNQHTYGNYMNMSERGCGPVALADAYNRRNGGNVNPMYLASNMASSGAYNPRRGTSVDSMVSMGNAMGMNMRVGGVTPNSIKSASPNRPITLLGSGSGFGTRNGNNHYVNVVGTDKNGMAYVSNPMSGRIERQPISSLALNSKLGLYGSGDELSNYGFSDEAIEAFEKLKDITSNLTGIFSGKKSNAQRMREEVERVKLEDQVAKIKSILGDKFDGLKTKAMDLFRSDNPQKPNESDTEYENRINKLWDKNGNSYLVQLGGQEAYDSYSSTLDAMSSGVDAANAGMNTSIDSVGSMDVSALSNINADGSSSIISRTGAEMAPFSPIVHTKTNITRPTSNESPVHDYFAATLGSAFTNDDKLAGVMTINGGWFGKSQAPVSPEGEGSSGTDSEGILIQYDNNNGTNPIVRAITGGTVSYVTRGGQRGGKDPNNGLGNSVKWRDSEGMYHWYLHLNSVGDEIQEGTTIEPNQGLGTLGNTGYTGYKDDRTVLRYIVTKSGPHGSTGDAGYVNPLTYWEFVEDPISSGGAISEDTKQNAKFVWDILRSRGLTPEQAAGIMGNADLESGFLPNNLENDYESSLGYTDESYTKAVDDGSYPEKSFVNDSAGYGLGQWTYYSRKQLMYDYLRKNNKSIADFAGQANFLLDEQPGATDKIKGMNSIDDITSYWLYSWEAPADPDGQRPLRIEAAHKWYDLFKNEAVSTSTPSTSTDTSTSSVGGRFLSTQSNKDYSGFGYFKSNSGAILANYGTPQYTATHITGNESGESPIHDFFTQTNNGIRAFSSNYNWYGNRQTPNEYGVGTSGDTHSGIDIVWEGGSLGKELHATTGGVVDRADSSSSTGNSVRWNDGSGFYHWYMHMKDLPLVKVGDQIEPGQLLGYAGNTGDSAGAHLHYNINQVEGFDGYAKTNAVNPLSYFSQYNADGYGSKDNAPIGLSALKYGGFTNGIWYDDNNNIHHYEPPKDQNMADAIRTAKEEQLKGGLPTNIVNPTASGDIPPLDFSKFSSDDYTNPIVINKYDIKSDTESKLKLIDRMSKITFNVRAQRVEALLEELIKEVKNKQASIGNINIPTNQESSPDLFNEEIPAQVTRLARG